MRDLRRLGLSLALAAVAAVVLCGGASAKRPAPRLEGLFATKQTVLESSDAGIQLGSSFDRTWLFAPACRKGACDVDVKVKSGSGFEAVHLTRKGSTYQGEKTVDAAWFCTGGQAFATGATRTIDIMVKVTGSSKQAGAFRATRVTGAIILDTTGKAGTLQIPGCNFSPSHEKERATGSLVAQKPGPRLEGGWTLSYEVTSGVFSELINAPVGSKGQVTWTFTPICPKGACDVLVTAPGLGGIPATVAYLTYAGGGMYGGVQTLATHLTCNGVDIYPGYLGSTRYEFHASGATATSLDGTAARVQDTTPAVNTAPGCNQGHIEANWSYASATASG